MFRLIFLSLFVAIPVSDVAAWNLSRSAKDPALLVWRRRLLSAGLVGNAASFLIFLFAEFHGLFMRQLVSDPSSYAVFALMAPASIVFGAFGRGASRMLVILSGLLLTWVWLSAGASWERY